MGPRSKLKKRMPEASLMHRGTDYDTNCKPISGPPTSRCVKVFGGTKGGYGNVLQFDCGDGIKLQYAHLASSNYNATSNVISTGDTGVGSCHLDYIMTIDGKVVDAQCSTGSVGPQYTYGEGSDHHNEKCPHKGPVNLCDPTVKQELKDHAAKIFKGSDKANYVIGDGSTSPITQDKDHEAHAGPGTVVFQGTGGKDGTGGVTPKDNPIEEKGKDPEEEEPEEPEPAEEYDPKASTPICDNSTCITQDTIDNAKHLRVKDDKVKTHLEYLTAEGKCKDPIETGITVLRQKPGKIVEYPDAFCTNVGCSYQNKGSGKGKCK